MFLSSAPIVTVVKGDTLSLIAAVNFVADGGLSWQAIYQDNESVIGPNPNLILVGERLTLGNNSGSDSGSSGETPAYTTPSTPSYSTQVSPSQVPTTDVPKSTQPVYQPPATGSPVSAPGGVNIPGMPQSLANCIWMRESTDGQNPAANGNQFGIIPASGYNVAGESVAQQEQTAGQIYRSVGGAAWAADGCPGT